MTDLENWNARPRPQLTSLRGSYINIDRAQFAKDADGLFAALCGPGNDDLWQYIPIGPYDDAIEFRTRFALVADQEDWMTYILRDAQTGVILGMASYMRIRPEAGSIEVGCIVFSKALQRTPAATEAMYLMASHIFDDLGYRRYEWKCNNANEASKNAATRFGFTFEGVFRQDMVMKGGNRDTAWYSIIDGEWPAVKAAYEAWLAPENFDQDGRQMRSLRDLQKPS